MKNKPNSYMTENPLSIYERLKKNFYKDVKSEENFKILVELIHASYNFLLNVNRIPLKSLVNGKEYFAFALKKKKSRAVNVALYGNNINKIEKLNKLIQYKDFTIFNPEELNKLIYTSAISFCCYIDLIKEGDQKTPGTYFEFLIGHLFAKSLGVNPIKTLPVLNLDMDINLPTDFIINLGPNQPKFHLPIKTSTRERVIQVWAHQRVLDGVYGMGRFLGTPVILAETKTNIHKAEVTEICLPEQWRIYQMHIAQLKRVYYLDVPLIYSKLNSIFPRISVKPFGDFFFELNDLII